MFAILGSSNVNISLFRNAADSDLRSAKIIVELVLISCWTRVTRLNTFSFEIYKIAQFGDTAFFPLGNTLLA